MFRTFGYCYCIITILFFCVEVNADSQNHDNNPQHKINGFIDFNGYYDTRDFSVFTLNLLANLPHRLQYFSLTNYYNAISADQSLDLNSFHSEQNLRWKISNDIPIDLTFQWLLRSGEHNDFARFGFRWRVSETIFIERFFEKIGMFYAINFHALETNFVNSINSWQIEHTYFLNVLPELLSKRVYISGIADHSMNYSGAAGSNNHRWVTEHQLGVKILGGFFLIAEYRYNDFLSKKHGVGLGAQYKILF